MKINSFKILKKLSIIILVAIFMNQEAFGANLKMTTENKMSSTTTNLNNGDPNATPPTQASSTASTKSASPITADTYDLKTAMYVISEVLKKIKIPNKDKDIYEQCIELSLNANSNTAMQKLWNLWGKIDFPGNEPIKKEPIDIFIGEAMTEVNVEVQNQGEKSKTKMNCAKSVKQTTVGEFNENMQKDLREILGPYFKPVNTDPKAKNIITAFISTYRYTNTGMRLIPQLNRLRPQ